MSQQALSVDVNAWNEVVGCKLKAWRSWGQGWEMGDVLEFEDPNGQTITVIINVGPGPSYGVVAVDGGETQFGHQKEVAKNVPTEHSDRADFAESLLRDSENDHPDHSDYPSPYDPDCCTRILEEP